MCSNCEQFMKAPSWTFKNSIFRPNSLSYSWKEGKTTSFNALHEEKLNLFIQMRVPGNVTFVKLTHPLKVLSGKYSTPSSTRSSVMLTSISFSPSVYLYSSIEGSVCNVYNIEDVLLKALLCLSQN
mgnify:CR=1 FL=1